MNLIVSCDGSFRKVDGRLKVVFAFRRDLERD